MEVKTKQNKKHGQKIKGRKKKNFLHPSEKLEVFGFAPPRCVDDCECVEASGSLTPPPQLSRHKSRPRRRPERRV